MAKNVPGEGASRYLKEEHGITVAPRSLADMRGSGTGPKYVRDGNRVLYPIAELDAWAVRRLGKPRNSTAEEWEDQRQRASA